MEHWFQQKEKEAMEHWGCARFAGAKTMRSLIMSTYSPYEDHIFVDSEIVLNCTTNLKCLVNFLTGLIERLLQVADFSASMELGTSTC